MLEGNALLGAEEVEGKSAEEWAGGATVSLGVPPPTLPPEGCPSSCSTRLGTPRKGHPNVARDTEGLVKGWKTGFLIKQSTPLLIHNFPVASHCYKNKL